ncbi:hypothetical protein GH733_016146 [Mirounga leonina]|nr:hypothetical protein GH733_016146 [Mirounga leonina]
MQTTPRRLKLTKICNLNKMKLKNYSLFYLLGHSPPNEQANQSLGTTHSGMYSSTEQLVQLNFKGLTSFQLHLWISLPRMSLALPTV